MWICLRDFFHSNEQLEWGIDSSERKKKCYSKLYSFSTFKISQHILKLWWISIFRITPRVVKESSGRTQIEVSLANLYYYKLRARPPSSSGGSKKEHSHVNKAQCSAGTHISAQLQTAVTPMLHATRTDHRARLMIQSSTRSKNTVSV